MPTWFAVAFFGCACVWGEGRDEPKREQEEKRRGKRRRREEAR
jgi:hypothetical protein